MKRPFHAYSRALDTLAALSLIFAVLAGQPVHAQETEKKEVKDPFGVDILDRASASTPLTYGVILGFAYPVWQEALTDFEQNKPEKFPRFEGHVYIDTWQLGYARQ